ncbi:MAG TPA: hypothetical protein VFV38_02075, partial [Ktedonobacteraceae bacterium]|nr:hypothetical protein [Ktedonobacteraceae bacterium]
AYRWGAAEALEERGARPRNPFLLPVISTEMEWAETEQMRHLVQHQLGMEVFARTWAEGRTMTVEHLLSRRSRAGVRDEAP